MASFEQQKDLIDYSIDKLIYLYKETLETTIAKTQKMDRLSGEAKGLEEQIKKLKTRVLNLENRLEDIAI